MGKHIPLISALCLSVLLFATGCSAENENSPADATSVTALQVKNLVHPERTIYASGQPTKEQLEALAESGIKHIVNLRPKGEQDWDEGAWVQSLGMTYHAIPVAGAAGITVDNAKALAELLEKTGNETTLVHCSSGNRVGALIAVQEHALKGQSVDAAVNTGKQWGLTGLEPLVRETLSNM